MASTYVEWHCFPYDYGANITGIGTFAWQNCNVDIKSAFPIFIAYIFSEVGTLCTISRRGIYVG